MCKDKQVKIDNYEVLGEEPFGSYDTSWGSVQKKLDQYNITVQQRNIPYIDRFLRLKEKGKI
jgi:hypothetical protein